MKMISLMTPEIDCCELLDKIIEKKRTPNKEILLEQSDLLKSLYDQYDINLPPSMPEAISLIKDILQSCYSNNSDTLQGAKKAILQSLADNHDSRCPYCMINRPHTFDHYLPQTSYPAYAVYPPNLIPGCAECNSIKGGRLFDGSGQRSFIHFYFDNIPEEQFLFFRFCFDADGVPIIRCFVEFPSEGSAEQIIKSHFEALKLCEKYKNQIDEKLSTIIQFLSGKTLEACAEMVQELWECKQHLLGKNYWETAFYEGILNSEGFLANLAN